MIPIFFQGLKSWIILLSLLASLWFWTALPALRWIDIHFFSETLKDRWGALYHSEDWSELAPLPFDLDYSWLKNASRPILIAHALGEAGHLDQNSLVAQQRALSAGLKYLEIDVWLDEAERLRCHHGPDIPLAPVTEECNLKSAVHAAAYWDAWLVIDIKTDFKLTGEAIVQQFRTDPSSSRLIFQLYRPADIYLFSLWAPLLNLPGPIVTAYQARRSLSHIATQLSRIGIKAITYPIYRGAALSDTSVFQDLTRFAHPVHDCKALKEAKRQKIDGYYLLTVMAPRIHGDYEKP
jgi:hypothetical protein